MRTCPNCGHMLSDKDTICFKCGIQLPSDNGLNYNQPPQQPQQMTSFDFRGGGSKKNNHSAGTGVLNLDGNRIYYILGVVIVIVVIIGIAVIVTKSNSNNTADPQGSITLKDNEVPEKPQDPKPVDPEPEKPVEPDNPEEPVDPEPEKPEEPLPPNAIQAGEGEHLVTNSNYTYRVPNSYIEKDYGKTGVDLIDSKNTIELMLSINYVSFTDIRASINDIKQNYMASGTTVYNVSTQIIEGSETILVEAERNNQRVIIGMLSASPGEIFVITAFNKKSNEFDYDLFKEGVRIAKTGIKDAVIINNTSNNIA